MIRSPIILIGMLILSIYPLEYSFAVEFNNLLISNDDDSSIDLSLFENIDYVPPGKYQMHIKLNGEATSNEKVNVSFLDKTAPNICLDRNVISLIPLTESGKNRLDLDKDCINISDLKGSEVSVNFGEKNINIRIPLQWLEYSDPSWVPKSQWENGLNGFIFDYNVNSYWGKDNSKNTLNYNSAYGYFGFNINNWRIRSDYQLLNNSDSTDFNINSVYAFTALPKLEAKLVIEKGSVYGDLIDSWDYKGASIISDERMLPPNLRGFAPQVQGIAETNAQVIISKNGQIVYQSIVPAGPFVIRDLDSSLRGELDVRVIEQDGRTKSFQVNTTYLPYMSRPGKLQFKAFAGKADSESSDGPLFLASELSYGLNNSWSLYGGEILAGDYNSLAFGVGHNLGRFGSLSSDVTQSFTHLESGNKFGRSWRVSYSKTFDEIGSDIQFAGYKFSEKDYYSMNDFLASKYKSHNYEKEKERYDIILNQDIGWNNSSLNLQYNYTKYWDRRKQNYYSASFNSYFDFFNLKDNSLNITLSKNASDDRDSSSSYSDDFSGMLSISIPIGNSSATATYSSNYSSGVDTHTINYSGAFNNNIDNYNLGVGVSHEKGSKSTKFVNGYITHKTAKADVSATVSTNNLGSKSGSISVRGGMTATSKGLIFHESSNADSARVLVDTKTADIHINGGAVTTNSKGLGIINNVSSYRKKSISIDVLNLPEHSSTSKSIDSIFVTEGSIGYKEFDIKHGTPFFVVLKKSTNTSETIPFGAMVRDENDNPLGIVEEDSTAWIQGINAGESIYVVWGNENSCQAKLPEEITRDSYINVLCR